MDEEAAAMAQIREIVKAVAQRTPTNENDAKKFEHRNINLTSTIIMKTVKRKELKEFSRRGAHSVKSIEMYQMKKSIFLMVSVMVMKMMNPKRNHIQ